MPRRTMPAHTTARMVIGMAALSVFAVGADAAWNTDWYAPKAAGPVTITTSPTTGSSAPAGTDPLNSVAPSATSSDRSASGPTDAHRALTDWSGTNPAAGDQAGTTGAAGTFTEVLRIPALGSNWAEPIYEGDGPQQLAAGVGHFPSTEQPGQVGNVAIAGHRSGIANPPFVNIDAIHPGDLIEITTAQRITYTYTVTSTTTVAPTDVDVIAEVPGHPDQTPTRAQLTLITCWPAYGHSKRVVVQAVLTAENGGAA